MHPIAPYPLNPLRLHHIYHNWVTAGSAACSRDADCRLQGPDVLLQCCMHAVAIILDNGLFILVSRKGSQCQPGIN